MWSERKHGLSTEQFPVSAHVGSAKNLNVLNSLAIDGAIGGQGRVSKGPKSGGTC